MIQPGHARAASQDAVYESTEHGRATINHWSAAPTMARTADRTRDGLPPSDDPALARELAKAQSVPEVATDLPSSRSSCEPHRSFIEAEAAKGRNAVAIYQDLVEHHGYDGAYNAVKRFVGKLRPAQPKVSCRFETDPGQEAQVDYGEGAFTRHPQTGKYRRPRLFAMKLSNSRRAFRRVVWESSSEIWSKLHEDAFAKFGGA